MLPGAEQLLSSGTRSSLHEQNREAVTIASHLLGETSKLSARVEILFDPKQVEAFSGALPRKNAQNLINRLKQHGYGAAIIGYLDFVNESVQVTNEKTLKITEQWKSMSAPIHRINPTLRLIKCTSFDSIIDVRSPSEFQEDHMPNAINLPVLDDIQRESIGTIYKQSNPFEAKRAGAALWPRIFPSICRQN